MKLADWMTAQGLDDEQMAGRVETDRTTISRIRRGINCPSWDLARRIKLITAGHVTADDFLETAARSAAVE